MLKASINSRQVSVNLLSLVLGRNVEDAAVKLQPATLSPTGAVAPNEGCIGTGIFLYLMMEGELNMQILLVCQYYFVYSKTKNIYKKT